MQTKRNNIENRKDSQEIAESAHHLSESQSAERADREDLTQAHLSLGFSGSRHSTQITASTTRRCFCLGLAGATLYAARPAATPVTGVQLEAVRALLRRQPDQTLKALADMGFKDAEGYNRPSMLALAPKVKQYGLTPRSCQVEVPLITQNWDPHPELKPIPLNEAIDGVAAAGIEFFTLSAIGDGERGDGDDFYRRTADRMNAAGDLCRKARIRFAWQLSALDFDGRPGFRAIDIYKERVDPKLAPMELDVAQALAAHQSADALLKTWKGHVPLVRTTGQVPTAAGIEYVFLGLDSEPDDPLTELKKLQSSTGSR